MIIIIYSWTKLAPCLNWSFPPINLIPKHNRITFIQRTASLVSIENINTYLFIQKSRLCLNPIMHMFAWCVTRFSGNSISRLLSFPSLSFLSHWASHICYCVDSSSTEYNNSVAFLSHSTEHFNIRSAAFETHFSVDIHHSF